MEMYDKRILLFSWLQINCYIMCNHWARTIIPIFCGVITNSEPINISGSNSWGSKLKAVLYVHEDWRSSQISYSNLLYIMGNCFLDIQYRHGDPNTSNTRPCKTLNSLTWIFSWIFLFFSVSLVCRSSISLLRRSSSLPVSFSRASPSRHSLSSLSTWKRTVFW